MKKCKTCLFHTICKSTRLCDNYYPADERTEEEISIESEEAEKREYYDAWLEYIEDYN